MREDFEAKNKQLLDEMPRFYGSRLDYFQPSFESLIRAQVRSPVYPQPGHHGKSVSARILGLGHRPEFLLGFLCAVGSVPVLEWMRLFLFLGFFFRQFHYVAQAGHELVYVAQAGLQLTDDVLLRPPKC